MKRTIIVHSTVDIYQKNDMGGFEKCVIVNKKYDDIVLDFYNMRDIINLDVIKCKLFNAKFYCEYKLKRGMEFGVLRVNESTTIYYHDLGNDNILLISGWGYYKGRMDKYFVEKPKEPIKISYDLQHIVLNLLNPDNSSWSFLSENKVVYSCKSYINGVDKECIQNYLNFISKDIIVDNVEISNINTNSRNDNPYWYNISISLKKYTFKTINLSEILKYYNTDIYLIKDNRLFVIIATEIQPNVKIYHLTENNILSKGPNNNFIGKKLI